MYRLTRSAKASVRRQWRQTLNESGRSRSCSGLLCVKTVPGPEDDTIIMKLYECSSCGKFSAHEIASNKAGEAA